MTALLVLALLTTPVIPEAAEVTASASCTGYTSRTTPPKYIRVFRIHRRGSSIPARVETWRLKRYVGAVMESGAWPRRPRASGMVGAQAIKQYAWWHVLHHQPGYSWKGRCYDIRDGDQYIERHWRPWMSLNRRTVEVIGAIWPYRLIKNGRLFRTGWRGGAGQDGWHLYEQTVTALARRGWSFRQIIHWQLAPVSIRP